MLARRVAEDGPGEGGEGGPGIRHNGCRYFRDLTLGDDEGGTAAQGLGGELGPVALEAGDRDEGEAGLYAARVVSDAPHPFIYAGRDLRAENPRELCAVRITARSVARARLGYAARDAARRTSAKRPRNNAETRRGAVRGRAKENTQNGPKSR